jgi:hypothetical protein
MLLEFGRECRHAGVPPSTRSVMIVLETTWETDSIDCNDDKANLLRTGRVCLISIVDDAWGSYELCDAVSADTLIAASGCWTLMRRVLFSTRRSTPSPLQKVTRS